MTTTAQYWVTPKLQRIVARKDLQLGSGHWGRALVLECAHYLWVVTQGKQRATKTGKARCYACGRGTNPSATVDQLVDSLDDLAAENARITNQTLPVFT